MPNASEPNFALTQCDFQFHYNLWVIRAHQDIRPFRRALRQLHELNFLPSNHAVLWLHPGSTQALPWIDIQLGRRWIYDRKFS